MFHPFASLRRQLRSAKLKDASWDKGAREQRLLRRPHQAARPAPDVSPTVEVADSPTDSSTETTNASSKGWWDLHWRAQCRTRHGLQRARCLKSVAGADWKGRSSILIRLHSLGHSTVKTDENPRREMRVFFLSRGFNSEESGEESPRSCDEAGSADSSADSSANGSNDGIIAALTKRLSRVAGEINRDAALPSCWECVYRIEGDAAPPKINRVVVDSSRGRGVSETSSFLKVDANQKVEVALSTFEDSIKCCVEMLSSPSLLSNAAMLARINSIIISDARQARGFLRALEEAAHILPHDEFLEAWIEEATIICHGYETLCEELQSAYNNRNSVLRERAVRNGNRIALFSSLALPWAVFGGMMGMNLPSGLEAYAGSFWGVAIVCLLSSYITYRSLK